MSDDDGPHTPILAESSLCTVLRSDDGYVYIQIGYVIVRLPERDVASLAGTLNKVVRQLFPREKPRERVELRVIRGGDGDGDGDGDGVGEKDDVNTSPPELPDPH